VTYFQCPACDVQAHAEHGAPACWVCGGHMSSIAPSAIPENVRHPAAKRG
jgi:hypothetical protein